MEEGIDPRKLEGVGRDDSQFDLRFLNPFVSLRVPNIGGIKEPTDVPNYLRKPKNWSSILSVAPELDVRISRLTQLSVPEHLNVLIHSLASSLTWASLRNRCRAHFSRRGWTFQWWFCVLSMRLIVRSFEPRETFLFQLGTLPQKTGVRLSGNGRRRSGFKVIDLATV